MQNFWNGSLFYFSLGIGLLLFVESLGFLVYKWINSSRSSLSKHFVQGKKNGSSGEKRQPIPIVDEEITKTGMPSSQALSYPGKNRPLPGSSHITKPLPKRAFTERPSGSVFAGRYELIKRLFAHDRYIRYLVTALSNSEDPYPRQCSNLSCKAIYSNRPGELENCPFCASPPSCLPVELVLTESLSPIYGSAVEIASKCLVHPGISAPLDAFSEKYDGSTRYCLVTPRVHHLPIAMERVQALKWGAGLAYALDYLSQNGISFDASMDDAHVAMLNDHPVWSDFTRCRLNMDPNIKGLKSDIHNLATLLFKWSTGQKAFTSHSNLPESLKALFDEAINGRKFTAARDFACALESEIEMLALPCDFQIRTGQRTHLGKVRSLNEDSLLTVEINRMQKSTGRPLGVYVVADGMGGHAAGEVASGLITERIGQRSLEKFASMDVQSGAKVDWSAWVHDTVAEANQFVYLQRHAVGSDMGSTLVMLLLDGETGYIAHVGDSRAYLINTHGIQQLTTDHSLVERLVASQKITRQEARSHPQRNVIYRTIGDRETVTADVTRHTFFPGEFLLLCSDGLTGMIPETQIFEIVMDSGYPQEACDRMVEAANSAGGEDNISVVLIELAQINC